MKRPLGLPLLDWAVLLLLIGGLCLYAGGQPALLIAGLQGVVLGLYLGTLLFRRR